MFLSYLRCELLRRRRQAIIVAVGLGIGIGLVITVTAASTGVGDAQDQVLKSLYGVGTDLTVTQPVQASASGNGPQRFNFNPQRRDQAGQNVTQDRLRATPGQTALAATAITTVSKLDGVAAAGGGLGLIDLKVSGQFGQGQFGQQGGGERPQGSGQGQQGPVDVDSFTVTGVDVTRTSVGPLSSATVSKGRTFTTTENNGLVALVSASYASDKKLGVNSKLTVAGKTFTIVGVVAPPTGGASSDVYLPLTQAQTLANLAGKVTTIYIKADSASSIPAVKKAVQKALPNATVTTSDDLASQVSGSLSSASSLASNLGRWLAIAVLLAAFLSATLFTVSAISRRTGELGTLKAIGWRGRRIVAQIMGESLAHGLIGAVFGIALGFGGAAIVNAVAPTLSATVGNTGGGPQGPQGGGQGRGGFARAAEAAAQTVQVHLSASVSLTTVLLAAGLALAGGLIAGSFGAWRASRLRPAVALRQLG